MHEISRGCGSRPPPQPRLNSQLKGATTSKKGPFETAPLAAPQFASFRVKEAGGRGERVNGGGNRNEESVPVSKFDLFHFRSLFWAFLDLLEGSFEPLGPKAVKKVQNEFPRLWRDRKSPKQSRKRAKMAKNSWFRVAFDCCKGRNDGLFLMCSKRPSLLFVYKHFLSFWLLYPGSWEDSNTKTLVNNGPKCSVTATTRDESVRNQRLPFATKTLPTRKKYFRIIFRLPFHDFDFFELILEITRYLLHLCELCDITRLGPLSLLNYFLLPLPDSNFSELIG